jgi:hypothetical protein
MDVRINPSPKLEWEVLLSNNKPMLQAYQIMVTKILSRLTPTNLRDLRTELIYNYFFSNQTVDDLFYFLSTNPCKHIEFEEINGCFNSESIYLAPRIKLSLPVGAHSIFIPH